jgi:hypothetical protein
MKPLADELTLAPPAPVPGPDGRVAATAPEDEELLELPLPEDPLPEDPLPEPDPDEEELEEPLLET